MAEVRFFDPAHPPVWTTPEWYAPIERAPHLEQPEHAHRLYAARDFVLDAVERGAEEVSDLGAGDGGLLSLLGDIPAWGYDLIDANLAGAVERGVDIEYGDFIAHPERILFGDCVVMTEVLEHLIDPHGYLRTLPDYVRFVVASSPNGETWESRYEFHAWGWDLDGYRQLFEGSGWRVARHDAIPGFQVLLAQR